LAAGGLTWRLQGLHSLPWKETNRLKAMQRELGKVGIRLLPKSDGVWEFSGVLRMEEGLVFEVYGDHRMAMALAVLGIRGAVVIKDPQVVGKSYAGFWRDLEGLGFDLLKF
jgi:3-phosphoshikimate 1-carboxyvinyltransferase